MSGVERSVLVAAAWAEHAAAHDGYVRIKQQLRDEGLSHRAMWRRGRMKGAHARLTRAWLALHELGEVELNTREKAGRG